MRRRAKGRGLLAASLAAVALLTGCVSIPTSGPVQVGHGDRGGGQGQQPIQVFAQRPHPGWTPAQIVTGFLAAMASPDADHAVARSYLTPDIRESWPTGQKTAVVIYARDENFRLDIGRDNTVTVSAAQVATISNRREYRPSRQDATMHAVFRMQRVKGQWRIGSLPGNLLLDETDAVAGYVPFDLYFFSQSAGVLVPDPIVLPAADSDEWAAQLLHGLLTGPTPSMADGVVSAIPKGTSLDAQPVLDSDGTLNVSLGGAASNVTGEARQRMIAEIVATLMRVDGVSQVRVQTDATQTAPAYRDSVYSSYDPSRVVRRLRGYFVRDGKLMSVETSSADVEPLKGPFGSGAVRFKKPAVSLDAGRVAAVSPSGRSLLVGPLDVPGKVELLYRGRSLSRPSWDRNGDLWVVDNGSGGPRVLVFRRGRGKPVTASAPGLAGHDVTSVRLAWDGTRIAFVTSGGPAGQLQTGVVSRQKQGISVHAVHPVAPSVTDATDVWWYDQRSLAVVGREQSDLLATYVATVDGLSITKASSVSDVSSVAAAPGQPLLISDSSAKLSVASPTEFSSRSAGRGTDPTYPG